jgi:hypothetical protein
MRRRAVLSAAVVLAVLAGAAPGPAAQEALRGFLPPDGAAAGWSRDGDLQEFAGEDLYAYIDGGAEIYQEYGFRRVVVQDYKDATGRSVSLEIFEMAAPDAAFGIYTFKRSGKGQSVPLGAGGDLEDYYLNFWKGRYLVTLTGFDEAPETLAGLQAIARVVDSRIIGDGEIPGLVGILPEEGLRPGRVKYIKGLLGLNNIYNFFSARGLGFEEAVKGDYSDGSTLIIMNYGSLDPFGSSWAELRKHLDQSDRFKRTSAEMTYRDGKGRFISIAGYPVMLYIAISSDADITGRRMKSIGDRWIRE